MAECQSGRVQRLPGSDSVEELSMAALRAGNPTAAASVVNRIADHRVPHVLQMHPDLMGSAGVQLQPEQVDHIEAGRHKGIGPGGAGAGYDRHALSVLGVPPNRSFDDERTGVEVSPGQGGVSPANPSSGDGRPQPPVGQISLGDQHQT